MSHIHLCMFFFHKLSSSEPRHVKFTVSTSAGEPFPCSPKALRQCRCLSTSSHEKKKGSRSASNLWLVKQQTETNHSQIKSRIKRNLTFFCSLGLWFMIDLQMWTLRLCLIPWICFLPSGCTQAVTARLCKMPRAKPPVQAVIDIADTMRPRRHWAAEAQAAKLQVKSITSWRWLCRWRSSEHDAKWKLKQDFDQEMQNKRHDKASEKLFSVLATGV